MSTINNAYQSIADVNLWLKSQTNDKLNLIDIPSLIPLRWQWLRDTWPFIKQSMLKKIKNATNPDLLNQQILDFDEFISIQRVGSQKINPFSDSATVYRYYTIFDNISVNSVNLTTQEIRIVNQELTRIKAFSKNDFIKAKNNIISYRDVVTDQYGLSDDAYNASHNRSPVPQQITAGINEENYLLYLQHSLKTIDFILSNLFAVDVAIDPFALARANARNPDINIGQYSSGYLVRMNYGDNLEALAQRYLGDANKWIDIAIANGLKPPYIDEIGEQIPLLSNGRGNQINIAGTNNIGELNINKLYINQPVFLQSNTQVLPNQRSIINIRQIPISGEIVIELDGDTNMDLYTTSESAYVRIYALNTINSSFYVLIPSNEPLPSNRVEEVPWFLAKSGIDEKRAGIDLAIDNGGDLNFTSNGDIMLSYGISNAMQAIRLKIVTELGSLRYHPTFGMVNVLGQRNDKFGDIRTMLVNSINTQINSDSRFDRVENISVQYIPGSSSTAASAILIKLSVRMAGGDTVLPISFSIAVP